MVSCDNDFHSYIIFYFKGAFKLKAKVFLFHLSTNKL